MRRDALGIWARLPRRWTASPRRRRLLFVAAVAPSVLLVVLGAGLWHAPHLLIAGLLMIVAAAGARRISERRFLAIEAVRPEGLPAVTCTPKPAAETSR
ncbi:MAG TPA: hypothetical protein VF495_04340 [Phenylobacterium sp.]